MQFSVTLSRSILMRAALRDILSPSWRIILAYVCCLAVLAFDYFQGVDRPTWFAIGLLIFLFGSQVLAWWRDRRAIDDWLNEQGGQPLVYELSDFGVKATSQLGSLELKWEVFERLTIDDHLTLLHYPQRGRTTLPTAQIPPAALEMLVEQFLLHGKPVADARRK